MTLLRTEQNAAAGEYASAARDFAKRHKALMYRLESLTLNVAAARRGLRLPGSSATPFNEIVLEHQALLLAMLELGGDVDA